MNLMLLKSFLNPATIQFQIAKYVVIGVFVITVVLSYNHAIAKAETMEAKVKETELALETTTDSLNKVIDQKKQADELLTGSRQNEKTLRTEVAKFQKVFKSLQSSNPDVLAWAGGHIPSDVVSIMQQPTSDKNN